MAVTPDKYEFPIFIEDSASLLASKLNIKCGTVLALEQRKKSGTVSGRRIVKVSLDECLNELP